MLTHYRVARVAADPPRGPGLGEPGGWDGIVYFRLHGAPYVLVPLLHPISRYARVYAPDRGFGRRLVCIRQHRFRCCDRKRLGTPAHCALLELIEHAPFVEGRAGANTEWLYEYRMSRRGIVHTPPLAGAPYLTLFDRCQLLETHPAVFLHYIELTLVRTTSMK
jgi:hypothetical protein